MARNPYRANLHNTSQDDTNLSEEYEGVGEVRDDSPQSPIQPLSLRRRQSATMLDLQVKLESLAAENAVLTDEKPRAGIAVSDAHSSLSKKDGEIDDLKRSLVSLQNEVTRVTELNERLIDANERSNSRSRSLEQRIIKVDDESRSLKEEREKMIRSHTLETGELRKKISVLTEHLQKTETVEHLKKSETIPPEWAQIDAVKTDEVNEQERGTNEQLTTQNASLLARLTQLETVVAQLTQEDQNAPSNMGLWEIRRTEDIIAVIVDVMNGNLDCEIAIQPGENRDIANLKTSVNQLVSRLRDFYDEMWSVFREPSIEGSFHSLSRSQASATKPKNIWKELTDNVHQIAGTMTTQVRCISHSLQAVSQGDFSQKITEEASGEFLVLKEHTNHTIDMMNSMVIEVTKVSNDVAVDGVLGESVNVGQLQGKWKTMVDSVNTMAEVLTWQTRKVSEIANQVKSGNVAPGLSTMGPGRGELHLVGVCLAEMLIELRENWTRGTGEVIKVDSDKKSQEERMQRIWAILQSNI